MSCSLNFNQQLNFNQNWQTTNLVLLHLLSIYVLTSTWGTPSVLRNCEKLKLCVNRGWVWVWMTYRRGDTEWAWFACMGSLQSTFCDLEPGPKRSTSKVEGMYRQLLPQCHQWWSKRLCSHQVGYSRSLSPLLQCHVPHWNLSQSLELMFSFISISILHSALKDHRFSPITATELKQLSCTVSLLHSFEDCTGVTDWSIGTHGIYIHLPDPAYHPLPIQSPSGSESVTPREDQSEDTYPVSVSEPGSVRNSPRSSLGKRGRHMLSATFLPDVASEQGWTKLETIDSAIRKGECLVFFFFLSFGWRIDVWWVWVESINLMSLIHVFT